MADIKKYDPPEAEAIDSREVAEMVEKTHKDLLRDIRGYIGEMEGIGERNIAPTSKIDPGDFFITSTYTSDQGKKLPCFRVTKKGCEFVANKLTGEKGTKFTALYVSRFNVMEQHERVAIKGKAAPKSPQELAAADKRATAMLLNAKNRTAANLQKLYDRAGVKPEYQALALSDFYTTDGVRLPSIARQGVKTTYDKSGIAEKVGIYSKSSGGKRVHAQAVGAIIAELDIGSDEVEAVPYCRNGHDGTDCQYAESVVGKVKKWVEDHGWPAIIAGKDKWYGVIYKEGK